MENSIEEAIERLEYIDRTYSCNNYYCIWDLKCIETLLSEYKKLQKENEELRAKWDKDTHILQNELDLTNADKINNYIPVQKLKDKIEDLKMSGGSDGKDNTENTARELAIEALQNILEESVEQMNEEEKKAIEEVENLIKRCDECKLKECINCETNWTEVTSIKRIVDSYKKVLKELKDLQEYKRISELTKISCCTAQNCEALNTAIKGELENQKLRQENEELKIVKSAIQTLQINSIEDEKYIVISKSSFLDGSYKHLIDEYIPIQKVKAKIEELDIEISTCEYADDDSEEYKQEVEKNKAELLMARKVLQQLLENDG